MSNLDIEGVLSAHFDPTACVREHGMRGDVPMVEAHVAHVAAVLREQIEGALAEAKRDALLDAARDWPSSQWWGEFDDWLRDRAAHPSDTERAGGAG